MSEHPFILGAQYYRAPTPHEGCWEHDLRAMRELGLNSVKFWVQWRWSHRQEGSFHFADLDRLMDLAARERLAVHLNVIFDVAPHWLYTKFPDAKQITAQGRVIEPRVAAHRQIGGAPGPCYNHPGARRERYRFLQATVAHFDAHPALAMWDVWNEPELCYPVRQPEVYQDGTNLVCYCPHCAEQFNHWLARKYGTIERLNAVWGRCYSAWSEVELPRNGDAIADFVDWREFQQDSLTAEADWRLACVREGDTRARPAYLHVVPNTMRIFNSITGPDDSAILRQSSYYASTASAEPMQLVQCLSAAAGRPMYNVESHLNCGMLNMHQPVNRLPELLADWLPQIGAGFRGFMFWQYRPETLGREAPAWGLVNPDGTPRPVTEAMRAFVAKLTPHLGGLMRSRTDAPAVGVWKSRKNEFFHFAQHQKLEALHASVESYVNTLYTANIPVRFIDQAALEHGALDGVKLLILPSCYYLTAGEIASLDRWVRAGGVALVEAHLAGYNAATGRHETTLPGGGLAESWGLRESETTSAYHLDTSEGDYELTALSDDVRKALVMRGPKGGKSFPISLRGEGGVVWGAERFAVLDGRGLETLGQFGSQLCFAAKRVGTGTVFYAGTNLGEGSATDDAGFRAILRRATECAGVYPTLEPAWSDAGVRIDALREQGELRYLVIANLREQPAKMNWTQTQRWRGVFTDLVLPATAPVEFPPRFVDLFVPSGD
ncbi:MAG: beta-galactosidase [Opitutae bacterium]|nr:beta-galactosidase [Opitutae bacterium]